MQSGHIGPGRIWFLMSIVKPRKLAVFLDQKLGDVSFSDLNERSLLLILTHLLQKRFGLISVLEPLNIFSVTDYER